MSKSTDKAYFLSIGKVPTARNYTDQANRYDAPMETRPHFIKEWRKHFGKTQQDVATALGTSKGRISDIERDAERYNKDHLDQISDFLGIEPWQLIAGPPPSHEEDKIRATALRFIAHEAVVHHHKIGIPNDLLENREADESWMMRAQAFEKIITLLRAGVPLEALANLYESGEIVPLFDAQQKKDGERRG